jgi:hypothetical protein
MFCVKIEFVVTEDGESYEVGKPARVMTVKGFLPFVPYTGLCIETVGPESAKYATSSIVLKMQRVTWFPQPGGSGYFEVDARIDEEAGIVMAPEDCEIAFGHVGWTVEANGYSSELTAEHIQELRS